MLDVTRTAYKELYAAVVLTCSARCTAAIRDSP